jgi:putative membrane protein
MVWREVRKEGFRRGHYLLILLSAAAGFWMFMLNPGTFPQVTNPTLLQSVLLGVSVAATAIVPGVDPAVFLTSLGFYEMYVHALATLELSILAPMVLGLAAGAVGISFVMSQLFRRFYTATYSVIFGIFLSMIPNMLSENCVPAMDSQTAISLVLLILGFGLSYYLGGIGNKKERKG